MNTTTMLSRTDAIYPSLQGKTVFVTGGGTGIGADIVEAFAAQSCKVAFVDVATAPSEELVSRLNAVSRHPVAFAECDVRHVARLQSTMGDVARDLGPIAALVNNVANDARHGIDEVTPEYWDNNLAINQRPAFFAIKAVLPGMRAAGGGSIINLGSSGWQMKASGYPAYAVAKSSVNGLTRGLAKTLGADRIRINTVTPGWIRTTKQLRHALTPEAQARLLEEQCMPELVVGADVARMVVFLAAKESAMCTGQEFVVDGGWM